MVEKILNLRALIIKVGSSILQLYYLGSCQGSPNGLRQALRFFRNRLPDCPDSGVREIGFRWVQRVASLTFG